ncbi:HlyIII channel protein [Coprinopsis marcescibilis]|uniref:HlyIII channel protein n=1 Tax=Coprinopsis marcescibilis TaxID=230819 RepID=A0A5C3LDT8_COPMA|nr:HlyIII channel protein [Coprinopsis marcescibilis]
MGKTATNVLRQRVPQNEEEVGTHGAKAALIATQTRQSSKTLSWLDIEDWQRDNEFIITGYRRLQYSWKGCLSSVFTYLHNETVNIHSHLWGAALFIYLLASFYPAYVSVHSETTWQDKLVVNIFLLSAIFCLFGSALFHTSICHSREVATRCHALDYTGIVVLIVGSFFPSIYYGYFCRPRFQYFWLSLLFVMGVGAARIVLDPEYAKPTHRGARTAVFIALGLSAVAPLGHLLLTTHHFSELLSQMGLGWLITSGAMYIIGALLYANRIPERFLPGTFDHFGASHQLFHLFVVLAALAHFKGVLTAIDFRMLQSQCSI